MDKNLPPDVISREEIILQIVVEIRDSLNRLIRDHVIDDNKEAILEQYLSNIVSLLTSLQVDILRNRTEIKVFDDKLKAILQHRATKYEIVSLEPIPQDTQDAINIGFGGTTEQSTLCLLKKAIELHNSSSAHDSDIYAIDPWVHKLINELKRLLRFEG